MIVRNEWACVCEVLKAGPVEHETLEVVRAVTDV